MRRERETEREKKGGRERCVRERERARQTDRREVGSCKGLFWGVLMYRGECEW